MTTTPAPARPHVPTALEPDGDGAGGRFSLVEAVMDNLSLWTVLAAAIGLLYLVWATLEILGRYVGPIPSVTP